MLNLFKKSGSNKDVIEKIHNEFNLAGERLLKEAKEIIEKLQMGNVQKHDALKKHGFHAVKEVVETEAALSKKRENEKIAMVLEELNFKFPMYKFITNDMAMTICKKYNLVFGDVSQYTGFVPLKNLQQIDKFFETENELNVAYLETSNWSGRREFIYKEEHEKNQERHNLMTRFNMSDPMEAQRRYQQIGLQQHHSSNSYKTKASLKICAPLKDMKKDGYKLKGMVFEKEIPDPVVLSPIFYNGINLFCIVTAWGDEASDEIVVNQAMN